MHLFLAPSYVGYSEYRSSYYRDAVQSDMARAYRAVGEEAGRRLNSTREGIAEKLSFWNRRRFLKLLVLEQLSVP
jgi:hypothetical protein